MVWTHLECVFKQYVVYSLCACNNVLFWNERTVLFFLTPFFKTETKIFLFFMLLNNIVEKLWVNNIRSVYILMFLSFCICH